MIDIVKPIVTKDAPHIEAIHGHTIIELKNEKTGRRERIESDNTVTDGASSLLRSFGLGQVRIKKTQPLGTMLFGGMYLFDNTIPTDAKYMPAGTKMVGNGAYDTTNSGLVTELGSYNQTESSIDADNLTFVYDFNTAQANGNIKSVCLGTKIGALTGYGNSTNGEHYNNTTLFDDFDGVTVDNTSMPTHSVIKDNWYYYGTSQVIDATAGSLTIYKAPASISAVNLFTYATNIPAMQISITAPGYTSLFTRSMNNNKLFVVPADVSIPAGATFKVYEIDLETESVTEHSVTNTTGYPIVCIASSSKNQYLLSDTQMFVYGNNTWYILDFTTGVFFATSINISYYEVRYSSWYGTGYTPIGTNLVAIMRGNSTSSGWKRFYIYDMINDTLSPTNANNFSSLISSVSSELFIYNETGDYFDYYGLVFPNPFRLTTINNLSSPVQKTAADTMKVIYTLTME